MKGDSMGKYSVSFTAALFLVALGTFTYLSAPRVSATSETVTGKLVDLACYSLNKEETGNVHRGGALICAQACAREGFPVGLLTSSGKVYQVGGGLSADLNAKLVPHMSHTVTITGDVNDKGGMGGMALITASELKMVSE